jgi:hypothetical protein
MATSRHFVLANLPELSDPMISHVCDQIARFFYGNEMNEQTRRTGIGRLFKDLTGA